MKTEFITGNFKLDIEGEFTPDQAEAAQEAGLRYIVQRDVASKAYDELLGKDGGKRKEVEFSADNAGKVEKAFTDAMEKYGTFTVSVSEHIPGESAAPRAMATELWGKIKDNAAFRAQVGVAEGATDAQGIEAAHAFLSGLRKTPVRKPKAA